MATQNNTETYSAHTLTVWELFVSVVPSVVVCVSSICLSRVRSRKINEIGAKFSHLYRKSGSPSKNITSDFAPEMAKHPKSSPKSQNSANSVQAYCLTPLTMQLVIGKLTSSVM